MNKMIAKNQVSHKLNDIYKVQLIESRVLCQQEEIPQNNAINQSFINQLTQDCPNEAGREKKTLAVQLLVQKARERINTVNISFESQLKSNSNRQYFDYDTKDIIHNKIKEKKRFLLKNQSNPVLNQSSDLSRFYNRPMVEKNERMMEVTDRSFLKNALKVHSNGLNTSSNRQIQIINQMRSNKNIYTVPNARQIPESKQQKRDSNDSSKKSIVIRMQNYLLSKIPLCKNCSCALNSMTQNYELVCSNCSYTSDFSRSVPLLGLLYEVENNVSSNKWCEESLQQINQEIQRLECSLIKLRSLQRIIEKMNLIKKNDEEQMKIGKNELYNLLKQQQKAQNQQPNLESRLKTIIPVKLLEEINLWTQINIQDYQSFPNTCGFLSLNIPEFLKPPLENITLLQPLTNNFAHRNLTLSISSPIPTLPCLSLINVKFLVDGVYNITQFQHIKKLTLEFVGKRTFRELSLLMQKIPQTVEELSAKYDSKVNSHPSGEQYPLLSKLCALRMCKKLNLQFTNVRDEYNDILEMSRVLTKKKEFTLTIKKNAYTNIRNSAIDHQTTPPIESTVSDQSIITNILRKTGKGLMKLHLKLPISINRQKFYQTLIVGGYYKLYDLKIETKDYNGDKKPGLSEQVVQQMLDRKKLVIYSLARHKNKHILLNKTVREAVLGILIGD